MGCIIMSYQLEFSFEERLKMGEEKENFLLDILNLSGFEARKHNVKDIKDIDIELVNENILVDSKYMETPFYKSFEYTGIQPFNCLTVKVNHINKYAKKEKETGKEVWIACFICYKDYDIYELRFFKNSYLKNLVDAKKANYKLHFDRRAGKDLRFFLNYLATKRELNQFDIIF